MKNSKILLILIVSMVSISSIVAKNSILFPVADIGSVKISINDTSDNGNILHKLIKNLDNENLEITVKMHSKLGALYKDMKNGSKQVPYNTFPEGMAIPLYLQNKYLFLECDMKDLSADMLKELLLEKDNDGKTPIDLLKESSNPELSELRKDMEDLDVEKIIAELEKDKATRLEERKQLQEAQRQALLTLMLAQNLMK